MLGTTKKLLWIALFGLGILAGCSDHNSLSPDQAAIEQQIIDDTDLYGVDLMGENDPSNFAKSSATNDAIDPIGYGRRVRIVRDHLAIDVAEDGQSAVATITFVLKGQFVIRDLDSATGTQTVYLKPLTHKLQRKIHFVKNQDTTADRQWLRDGITPVFGVSENGTLSLTDFVKITIRKASDSTVSTFTITDPLNYFFESGQQFPTVHVGDFVKVEAAVSNSTADDTPYGILHRGQNSRPLSRVKHVMNDTGVEGDAVAGDGVYTKAWIVQNLGNDTGYHLGVIDFFSHSTIFDDTAPYNSLILAFPYDRTE